MEPDSEFRLLRRCGRIDPESLAEYEADGGFAGLRQALRIGSEAVIAAVKDAKLLGRGGAAFPTGVKWEGVARGGRAGEPHGPDGAPPGPDGVVRYVVCNADESEPGTFKDRKLMEQDPLALVEAMAIAGFAVGAARGYAYIRGEYDLASKRVQRAVDQARAAGYLGDRILGTDFRFDIHIRRGGGAYVCGEETALFASIEGFRGEPRVKPPFPTTHGLFLRPTAINNVETLCNVPWIVRFGADWFRSAGTEAATGTKLFCLSGAVARPGVYEVPFGTPLRELLEHHGGGIRRAGPGAASSPARLQALLVGGAAGAFLTPDQIDVALDFPSLQRAGATIGSGAIVAIDDSVDLWAVIARITRFFAHESCGKCVPCRIGTQRQVELVERLRGGQGRGDEAQSLAELGQAMSDASICGLGQTASAALQSAFRLFGPPRPDGAAGVVS